MRLTIAIVFALLIATAATADAPTGDQLLTKARELWSQSKYKDAAHTYRILIAKHPAHDQVRNGTARFWMWACFGRAGEKPDAVKALRAYMKHHPKHPSRGYALFYLGRYLGELGRTDEARKAFRELIDKHPKDRMVPAAKQALSDLGRNTERTDAPKLVRVKKEEWVVLEGAASGGLPKGGKPGYVVLTNLAEGDAYYAAVRKLAASHPGAKVLRFRDRKLADLTTEVRRIGPTYATFVTRPDTIDINFHYDVLEWSAALDNDPFVDLAYGFITGASAEDAVALVERIVAARRSSLPKKYLEFGPSSLDRLQTNSAPWLSGFGTSRLMHKGNEAIRSRAKQLSGCGIIRYWGHGTPERIVDSLRAEDLASVKIGPAIVFGGACYTGVVKRAYDKGYGKATVRGRDLAPEASFCLQLMRQANAFFAALDPDHGITSIQEFEHLVSRASSLGEAIKHGYDLLVMSGRGADLPIFPYVEGAANRRLPVEQIMLRGAASRVLFGDPAMRPLDEAPAKSIHAVEWRDGGKRLVCRPTNTDTWGSFTNIFRAGLGGVRGMNGKVSIRTPAPDGFDAHPVSVEATTTAGKVVTAFPTMAIESWRGKRYLHIQVDVPRGKPREPGFELQVRFGDRVIETTKPTGKTDEQGRYLASARRTAKWLLAASRSSEDGTQRWWPEHAGQKRAGQDLYSGTAGVLIDLANLYKVTGDEQLLAAIRQGCNYLVRSADVDEKGASWKITFERRGRSYDKRAPGLYTGAAGVGWVLMAVSDLLKEPRYLRTARQAADWILATAKRTNDGWHWGAAGYDIISGSAGIALFLLELHERTRHAPYLEGATRAADHLATVGIKDGKGMKWRPSSTFARVYPNFSHGTAGIAFLMARLHRATKRARYLEQAKLGTDWLIEHAIADGAGCKWYHYEPKATTRFQTGWCHGPAGTGYLFLLMHELTGEASYLKIAEKGAVWVAKATQLDSTPRFYSPALCCGATGIGEYYLSLYRHTGKRGYLDRADQVASALTKLAKADETGMRWTNNPVADKQGKVYYGTSHMVGSAGAAGFLLRLHDAHSATDRWVPALIETPDRRW